jgi:DNA recombination-mediator protein A
MLSNVPDPPPALFVNGTVPETVSVALVGSRKASATGIETARVLGLALAERGVCVVSGLALGIDSAGHEGAVEAGGPTVGVLGCGIDVTYPTKHKRSRVAVPRSALGGTHAPVRTNEGLELRRSAPTGARHGAQAATACRWWQLRGQTRPGSKPQAHIAVPRMAGRWGSVPWLGAVASPIRPSRAEFCAPLATFAPTAFWEGRCCTPRSRGPSPAGHSLYLRGDS